ncbi:MAG: DUF3854 domain-containing protein [Candidatus Pacebacteria bacterium]|nr:DUF3854 domain-containing protein [Candidatus Paceibacterota bacterium]
MALDTQRIAQVLQLKITSKRGDEYIFVCPFCSIQKEYPKLYYNEKKGTFYCHHCHKQGSITDLWAMRCNVSTKEAYKQMLYYSPDGIAPQGNQVVEEPPKIDYIKLHNVYSEFLTHLVLSDEHSKDLSRRGLPFSQFYQFRSLPEDCRERWNICSILNRKYSLVDVPGFRLRTSRKGKSYWDCINSGMLIPVRNLGNKILGFQIRTNSEPKYLWFAFSGQTKAHAHITNGYGCPWIIEGVLKSYIANYFLKVPCIGIPGTNAWKTVPFEMIRGGKVVVCYDNEENPYSAEAKNRLIKRLKGEGIEVIEAGWNRTLGKGIDDACLTLVNQGKKLRPELFLPGLAA